MQSPISVSLLLLLASLFAFGVSLLLIRINTHASRGGDDYVRRKKLKTFGWILLFASVLLLAMAGLNYETTDHGVVIDLEAAAEAKGYVPPVLPQHTSALAPQNISSSSGPAQAISPTTPAQMQSSIESATAAIALNPNDANAYGVRGNLYAAKRDWDAAARDYRSLLALDGTNSQMKFNLAEMSFMQKKYSEARTTFLALEQNPDLSDLAAYKVFLCDMFGGQPDAAAKELDAFNQVGANASYYFANTAWSIHQRKLDDARGWLQSANRIYSPAKINLYSATLIQMGYLPLP